MATAVTRPRLGHVAFRVRDLERSSRWYAEAFGAREAFRATGDDGAVQLVYLELAPGQFIELFPNGRNSVAEPSDPIGYAHTCLVVDDLPATLAHLSSVGVAPTAPPRTGRAGQRLTFITDPDGNRLELMAIPPDSPIYRPAPGAA